MSQGIPPAPLFYRCLQIDLQNAGDRAAILRHRVSTIHKSQRKAPVVDHLPVTMEWQKPTGSLLIASLRGWGAVSRGVPTGGPWSPEEKCYHINCMEILAAFLAIKTFMKNMTDTTVLIMIDNTTAVAYINNLGGTVSPLATEIAKDLWMWCLERNITVKAQYLPGVENVRADRESRTPDWMLNPRIFQTI